MLVTFLRNGVTIRDFAKFAVRIGLIFLVPEIIHVRYYWYVIKIVFRCGRGYCPFEGPAVPGVCGLLWNCACFVTEPGTDDVHSEDNHSDQNYEGSN